MQLELNFTETKERELFENESRGQITGHLRLLIGLTQKKSKCSSVWQEGFYKMEQKLGSNHPTEILK